MIQAWIEFDYQLMFYNFIEMIDLPFFFWFFLSHEVSSYLYYNVLYVYLFLGITSNTTML
jgi:hypothetical protein